MAKTKATAGPGRKGHAKAIGAKAPRNQGGSGQSGSSGIAKRKRTTGRKSTAGSSGIRLCPVGKIDHKRVAEEIAAGKQGTLDGWVIKSPPKVIVLDNDEDKENIDQSADPGRSPSPSGRLHSADEVTDAPSDSENGEGTETTHAGTTSNSDIINTTASNKDTGTPEADPNITSMKDKRVNDSKDAETVGKGDTSTDCTKSCADKANEEEEEASAPADVATSQNSEVTEKASPKKQSPSEALPATDSSPANKPSPCKDSAGKRSPRKDSSPQRSQEHACKVDDVSSSASNVSPQKVSPGKSDDPGKEVTATSEKTSTSLCKKKPATTSPEGDNQLSKRAKADNKDGKWIEFKRFKCWEPDSDSD